ncbi:GNAT family N-acetyltransferase [Plantactinospora sonchi]|uniref:GNAT family N-acetyltransferase n=1 Tax=Plantactinospora sonchi TaxID=1544735 RepID=A0ABU7RXF2_9ACTN
MPLHPDPDEPADSVLRTVRGTPLARLRIRDDDGERIATDVRPLPGADLPEVVDQARRDLAGLRLETPDDNLLAALLASGLERRRAATDLRHDLADLPAVPEPPVGWTLTAAGWDDDLAEACAAAYGPDHPDGSWSDEDTRYIQAMYDTGEPVPPLRTASARVVGPDGRSAGHVLCAGPVPWTDDVCAWILNIAVAPHAQGHGLGRALLIHALHGTRAAGLPTLGLQVADGNPARAMYDRTGFRVRTRILAVQLPA